MKQTPVQSVFMFLIKAIHKNVFQINKKGTTETEESDNKGLRWIRIHFVLGMQLRFQNAADCRTVLVWRCYGTYANIAFPIDTKVRLSEVGIYQQREIIPITRYFEDDKDSQKKIAAIHHDVERIKDMLLRIDPKINEYFE